MPHTMLVVLISSEQDTRCPFVCTHEAILRVFALKKPNVGYRTKRFLFKSRTSMPPSTYDLCNKVVWVCSYQDSIPWQLLWCSTSSKLSEYFFGCYINIPWVRRSRIFLKIVATTQLAISSSTRVDIRIVFASIIKKNSMTIDKEIHVETRGQPISALSVVHMWVDDCLSRWVAICFPYWM